MTKTKNRLEKRIRRLMYMEHGQYGYKIQEREHLSRLGMYEKTISIKTYENGRRIDRPVAHWSRLRDLIDLIKELRYLEA